jgi:hypothetical protein
MSWPTPTNNNSSVVHTPSSLHTENFDIQNSIDFSGADDYDDLGELIELQAGSPTFFPGTATSGGEKIVRRRSSKGMYSKNVTANLLPFLTFPVKK